MLLLLTFTLTTIGPISQDYGIVERPHPTLFVSIKCFPASNGTKLGDPTWWSKDPRFDMMVGEILGKMLDRLTRAYGEERLLHIVSYNSMFKTFISSHISVISYF